MRNTIVAAVVGLLAAAAPGAPLFLDAEALRAEVSVRRAVYGASPAGAWEAQARLLDRVLRSLDTAAGSLDGDLRTAAEAARLLGRFFSDDGALQARLAEVLDQGEAIVAGTLDVVAGAAEAAPAGRPTVRALDSLDRARGLLDRSRRTASPDARGRLLRRALARVEMARAALGAGPGTAGVSATVAVGPVAPTSEFLSSRGGALVTLDGDGLPTGLLLRFRRAAPGGPASASLEIRVDAGFTGTGTWPSPAAFYDHDGLRTAYSWTMGAGGASLPTNFLSVTAFDPAEGRIAGTFQLGASANAYRTPLVMTEGVFEVTGVLFRGP